MSANRPYRSPDRSRPYRVGMAREPQRYIEPDAIYEDLSTGPRERIPRRFPFSWNPVNGLGATEDQQFQSASIIDDVWSVVKDTGTEASKGIVDDTKKSVEDRVSTGVEDFINSTPGKKFLDKVEQRATEGVTGVVKQNAPYLMLLAVAGGSVGGALSSKLGKTGTVLALAVAAWSGWQLLNAQVPVEGASSPKKR